MLSFKFIRTSFVKELEKYKNFHAKSCLIIGGAGTIGSNYIKQLIKFKPCKIVVVDINENGLTELTRYLRSSKHLLHTLMMYNRKYIM